jgi:hypothetical protein
MLTGGIQIPHPKFFLKERPLRLDSFRELHRLHPGLLHLYDLSGLLQGKGDIHMDQRFRIRSASGLSRSGAMNLTVEKNGKESGVEIHDISGFMKVTHLLDPISWLRGRYGVEDVSGAISFFKEVPNEKIRNKLNNHMNQAYVEAVASYCLSKLREGDISPHFHYFYGAFRGISDTYSYNISDVFASYRHCRWFWNHQLSGIFELSVDNEESLEQEVLEAIFEPPSTLHSETDSSSDDETEELESLDEAGGAAAVELESLSTTSMENVSYKENKDPTDDDDDESSEEDNEETDDEDEDNSYNESLNVLAKIHDFPVMLLFTESSEGTMDSLVDNFDEVGAKPGTKKWDEIWLSWLFQIISALCVVQAMFGFSHNDLHTNNIVWVKTDIKFLVYRARDGTTWKVPTHGKIFRIIDFGRAIFWINKKLFCSDDFSEGNDAADQYNFGPLKTDDFSPEIHPNPSFDLCRLAVSLFEGLFPVEPLIKKGAMILSAEPGLKVKETESDLYNLLWSWMIDEDGRNVMREPNGKERYPDFNLYKVIAAKVHEAIPSDQITRPIFDRFRVSKSSVGKAKVYNLFC